MANTFQIKRGLEANRTSFIPKNGELIYTTDTKKLYVGDGTTPGGIAIGKDLNLEDLLDIPTPVNGDILQRKSDGSGYEWVPMPNSGTTLPPPVQDSVLYSADGVTTTWSNAFDFGSITTSSASLIPAMTSNTTPSGVVTASSYRNVTYEPWRAFNGDTTLFWWAGGTAGNPWIQYDFQTNKMVTKYELAKTNIKTWELQGWNGASWTTVDSVSLPNDCSVSTSPNYTASLVPKSYTVANPGYYSMYRLQVVGSRVWDENPGGGWWDHTYDTSIDEAYCGFIQMYGF